MRRVTCKQGEVCWTGDGYEWGRHVSGPDTILGHGVQVGGVHISVIVPAESIKGDQKQLVPDSFVGFT